MNKTQILKDIDFLFQYFKEIYDKTHKFLITKADVDEYFSMQKKYSSVYKNANKALAAYILYIIILQDILLK